jgi:hypothetical protein
LAHLYYSFFSLCNTTVYETLAELLAAIEALDEEAE